MKLVGRWLRGAFIFCFTIIPLSLVYGQTTPRRAMQPEDLFRVRQIRKTAWSADGRYAAIEFTRPGRTLDGSIPTSEIGLLDTGSRKLRILTSNEARYTGFFDPIWAPTEHRLAFLSVDSSAIVQPWIWTSNAGEPEPLSDLDVQVGLDDPSLVWIDDSRIAIIARDIDAPQSGNLYFRLLRGRNVADGWERSMETQASTVSVLESGGSATPDLPSARLVSIDVLSNERTTLARGPIHRLSVVSGGRYITFIKESPGIPGQTVDSFFDLADDPETMYDAVSWGTETHFIDSRTGQKVTPEPFQDPQAPTGRDNHPSDAPPRADARRLSVSPMGDAALFAANGPDGSHLWLGGGAGQPLDSYVEIWTANEWMAEIQPGRAEPIEYRTADGTQLVAWILLPARYQSGDKVPAVTIVYPGLTYRTESPPASFSLFNTDFEHPQLFAAMGYAVLLPSMPLPKDPTQIFAIKALPSGVLPAVEAAIDRGMVDSSRVAVVGQSGGGFASLGLITQTTRFRSAIASASFSNLTSLYGTFYGQYRYGDAGPPQKGQILRMLQMEKGFFELDGPPWQQAERYQAGSAILAVDRVQTPLMLVHGDLDFIPIQQAEEFFTALYRQDKRAVFLRYQGEWHTIAHRANVIDLWSRIGRWLNETMPAP